MTREVEIMETVKRWRAFVLLGPATVLSYFSQALTGIVFTDLILYRTCLVSLNINSTECLMSHINTSSPEAVNVEAKVEPYASVILMTKSLIETILPAVFSLFLGPWSDRRGRRPLLLAALSGFTLQYLILSVICNWNISPWYLLCASIPATITGGLCTLILATTCCVSDTTLQNDRMRQFASLEGLICGGEVLGKLIGPFIYNNYGYINVFRTAAICSSSALVYIYFCVPETVENASKESIRRMFKISTVKELINSSFVKRERFNRPVVWLGITTFTMSAMITQGQITIGFLFTRIRLGWDVEYYSYLGAVMLVLRITGLCAVSLISPFLGVSDTFLAGVALVSALSGSIAKSLTWKSWHMYLSVCIGMFGGIIGPVMRSIISKSVPAQDVGKVFSLTAFLQASSPLAGAPLFTFIHSHYLPPIYPSPVYLFSTSVCTSLLFCVVSIDMLLKKSRELSTYTPALQDDNKLSLQLL